MTLFPDIDREEALEQAIHVAAADFLLRLEQQCLLTFNHSPNEGKRSDFEREQLAAKGMKSGHPDLDVYLKGGRAVFFELKTRTGWVGPKQKLRHAVLKVLGYDVHIIKAGTPEAGVQQMTEILSDYGVRERHG